MAPNILVFLLLLIPISDTIAFDSEQVNTSTSSSVESTRLSHGVVRVHELQVNETVHSAGSELVFSWERCDFCESFRLVLSLNHILEDRILSYELRGSVTSFRVGQIRPRTKYGLEIKAVPDDSTKSSFIGGVTYYNATPPSVQELAVRPLTNTSLHVEWVSDISDGSLIKVRKDDVVVQEKQLPFNKKQTLTIDGLEAGTRYAIHVVSFFEPKTEKSMSPAAIVETRTLPSELPDIQFRWEEYDNGGFKLLWNNPKWPYPVGHSIVCRKDVTRDYLHSNREDVLNMYMGGSSDFLAVRSNNHRKTSNIDCTLTTWYSSDPWSKKVYRLTIPSAKTEESSESMCGYSTKYWKSQFLSYASIDYQAMMDDRRRHGLFIKFTTPTQVLSSNRQVTISTNYQLCTKNNTCSIWKKVTGGLYLGPRDMIPWTSYILKHQSSITCGERWDYHSRTEIVNGFLELPEIWGPMPSVNTLDVSQSGNSAVLSWTYNSLPVADYFLVTSCSSPRSGQNSQSGLSCSSTSLPAEDRSTALTSLEEGQVHFISLHVGKVRGNVSVQSEPKVISFYVPKQENPSEEITLEPEEIIDSPYVKLHINYNASTELPDVVEFHVHVCKKLLCIWDGDNSEKLIQESDECEQLTASPENSTVKLLRRPWTQYEITVSACYGAFDSTSRSNTTLPIYKPPPGPLAGLAWDEDKALLSWKYRDTWKPSGFRVSLCTKRDDPIEACTNIETGHLDRQYEVNLDDLPRGELVVFVAPFVRFGDSYTFGPRSELIITTSEDHHLVGPIHDLVDPHETDGNDSDEDC